MSNASIIKPNVTVVSASRRKFSLDDMTSGRLTVAQRVLGFGGEKVGKSSWASGAPGAVFLGAENGTSHLNVRRLPVPETWDELFEVLALSETDPTQRTIVIDPVNWLEDLVFARVVGGPNARPDESTRDKLEKHGGGFKQGYDAAVSHWRTLINVLEKRHYDKAHADVKNFKDPTGSEYMRYSPALHHKAAGLIKQWVDDVLFFRHEVLAKVEGAKTIAIATGDRIVHTEWSKAWDAGNRSSLPTELPMAWSDYWAAVEAGRQRVPMLHAQITTLLKDINDSEVTKHANAMVAEAKDDASRLTEIVGRLQAKKDGIK
jgi:hypothetical protein